MPNSVLAKIFGIYSIKIAEKTKVYHILMESVDPINEYFIKFKYDLKFSSVNRREYRSRLEANIVREELLETNPYIHELFEVQKDLSSLYDLDKSGSKKLGSIGSFDNKAKTTKKHMQLSLWSYFNPVQPTRMLQPDMNMSS